ncbi:MAG: sigma-70 family RNA polymerase sigma factor [Planctomycetes bacterium]|nr:sigma-70 family RNA polymerase sigma factor [Planctomycetota bacterium]
MPARAELAEVDLLHTTEERNLCHRLGRDDRQEIPARESSPSKVLQREERYRRFEKAIASLSPDYREVLRLVRLEGLSVTEVAKQLNRSPHAVSQLLLRALKKLRQSFKRTGSLRLQKPGEESGDREDSSDG